MPAGTLTSSLRFFFTRPCPPQAAQVPDMILPFRRRWAGLSRLNHAERRALRNADLATAVTLVAGLRAGTRLGPAATAAGALFQMRYFDGALDALGRLHKRDTDAHIDIVPRMGPFGSRVRCEPPKPPNRHRKSYRRYRQSRSRRAPNRRVSAAARAKVGVHPAWPNWS